MDGEHVWNFAYGANMNRGPVARRKLMPLETLPGVLKDHKLVFNHFALGLVEPVFGNVEPCPGSHVHGALHKLTRGAYRRLLESEGGGGGKAPGYTPVLVMVQPYDKSRAPIQAYVLMSDDSTKENGRPSARYMTLLIDGARQLGLDADYVRALEAVPTFDARWPRPPPADDVAAGTAPGTVTVAPTGAVAPSVRAGKRGPVMRWIVSALFSVAWLLAIDDSDDRWDGVARRPWHIDLRLWALHRFFHLVQLMTWSLHLAVYGKQAAPTHVVFTKTAIEPSPPTG